MRVTEIYIYPLRRVADFKETPICSTSVTGLHGLLFVSFMLFALI
jgi:hypothetical protein